MKNKVLLSVVLIGLVALAAATPVQCSVLLTPNETGASTDLYAVTAPVGFYISSLTLTDADDYTGYQNNNPVVSLGGTLSPSAALTTPPKGRIIAINTLYIGKDVWQTIRL